MVEQLLEEKGTFADTQLADRDRRMPPMPAMVRVFQGANGETTRLTADRAHEDAEIADLAAMERERDVLSARISARKRGRPDACADDQQQYRHRRPDEDEDQGADSWDSTGDSERREGRGGNAASSASYTSSSALCRAIVTHCVRRIGRGDAHSTTSSAGGTRGFY